MKRFFVTLIFVLALVVGSSVTAMAAPPQQGGTVYQVQAGDTLSSIATRFGVTEEALLRQNGLANPNMLFAGQTLVIPASPLRGGGYQQPPAYSGGGCTYHMVRPGETLSGIAYNYGLSVSDILGWNSMRSPNMIFAGQQLCVRSGSYSGGYTPQGASYNQGYQPSSYPYSNEPIPPADIFYHTIVPGETVASIARDYGTTEREIILANNMSNPNMIRVGQNLIIPRFQPQPRQPNVGDPGPVVVERGPSYVPPASPPFRATDPNEDDGYYYKDDDSKDGNYTVKEADTAAPPAPSFDAMPDQPIRATAEHPIEVIVNGGETWGPVSQPLVIPDPKGISTLIVKTGDQNDVRVRVRSGNSESTGTSEFNGAFGPYRFIYEYIPPGEYDVWIDDPDVESQKVPVSVGAGDRVEVVFSTDNQINVVSQNFASPDGWFLADFQNPSRSGQNTGSWSTLFVQTPASGLNVVIESEGGYRATCFTGRKGPGACEFGGLGAGFYTIFIDGTKLKVTTYLDGSSFASFTLGRQDTPYSNEILEEDTIVIGE